MSTVDPSPTDPFAARGPVEHPDIVESFAARGITVSARHFTANDDGEDGFPTLSAPIQHLDEIKALLQQAGIADQWDLKVQGSGNGFVLMPHAREHFNSAPRDARQESLARPTGRMLPRKLREHLAGTRAKAAYHASQCSPDQLDKLLGDLRSMSTMETHKQEVVAPLDISEPPLPPINQPHTLAAARVPRQDGPASHRL